MRALITGASGGIGEAIAYELAGRGIDLVLAARTRSALERVTTACTALGVRADIIVSDLGLPGAATALWNAAMTGGALDIVVNNAGFGYFRPFADVEWHRDSELLQLDIVALVEISKLFVRDCAAGYLLNVGSTAAYQSVPNMAVYSAAKAFVRNFTESLHDELRGSARSATCISPGGTTTGFHAMAGAGNYGWVANRSMLSAERVAAIAVRAMFKRKRNVVSGVMNKISCWGVRFVPRSIASWMSRRVLGKPRAAALPSRTAA